MRSILSILVFILLVSFTKGDKQAFLIHNQKGKVVKYEKVLKELEDADVLLIGELHNNPISHWLQLELTKDMAHRNPVLGAEMYEKDNQVIMDEFLAGYISGQNFKDQMRLWKNNATDYQPLVDWAKENKRPFIATNVPRRYASLVFREGLAGLDKLSEEAKSFMAPLPIEVDYELASYKAMLDMGMGHGGTNIVDAQALKDATMAHSIMENKEEGSLFIHYNGTYHSNQFEGIYHYLMQADSTLKIVTIASIEKEDPNELTEEELALATFILAIDEDMTKTYK